MKTDAANRKKRTPTIGALNSADAGAGSQQRLISRETIVAGKYELRKWQPGKFWLSNGEGEGMETSEAKIEKMLDGFFKREF